MADAGVVMDAVIGAEVPGEVLEVLTARIGVAEPLGPAGQAGADLHVGEFVHPRGQGLVEHIRLGEVGPVVEPHAASHQARGFPR